MNDFGPLTVKMKGRGSHQEKRWICIFTCLVTRAVHLEVSYSMTVDDFQLCFSKFSNLRQRPQVAYSDNGLNSQAGEKEIKKAIEEWNAEHEIQAYAAQRGREWHFPRTDHISAACAKG